MDKDMAGSFGEKEEAKQKQTKSKLLFKELCFLFKEKKNQLSKRYFQD